MTRYMVTYDYGDLEYYKVAIIEADKLPDVHSKAMEIPGLKKIVMVHECQDTPPTPAQKFKVVYREGFRKMEMVMEAESACEVLGKMAGKKVLGIFTASIEYERVKKAPFLQTYK